MNRRKLALAMTMTIWVGFSFLGVRPQLGAAKGPLSSVDSYTIYYGSPTVEAMNRMKKLDMAILEPTAYTKEQIQELQAAGTMLIGYISVMESPVWNTGRMQRLASAHYYQPNGQKVHFTEWDSYLMDLRDPIYRDVLLEEIQRSVIDHGLDGIFLDTVGDIDEYVKHAGVRQEMREAYRTLLQQITGRFGPIPMIQNRGFNSLELAAPYIEGILWEDWRADWEQDAWTRSRVEMVLQEQGRGLKVFSVSSSSDVRNGKSARKLRFVHLDAPGGYGSKAH
ncbi:endo alpha-1,4 polygalactosaminidase [Paenibacillus sp. GD4]|uniref:putative glycoside hydrolase n=1 Tax=Paenibacillus sp. GD4 TaxID=3068890 RepID=UPI0027968C52|nr:endo alpha-1,4 polygalactosaminidase [Paenibacillus sp. GD4]MDQ1912470.1 endo alpha-1,4 polygalactosaminidase [Paenibacillus sp. GD4]